jgi:hypothetical protein
MLYEEMRAIVDQAAELLPEPPPARFADLYTQWETLTVDTGIRLAELADGNAELIEALEGDGLGASLGCSHRRRLLLHVMRVAALQMSGQRSSARFQTNKLPGGTIVITPAESLAGVLTR